MSNQKLNDAVKDLAAALETDPDTLSDWVEGASRLMEACHTLSKRGGWWHDPATGEPLQRNKGEMLMLMVSEVAEAMEGERKGLDDEKLPHRLNAEVELADLLIRAGDYGVGHGYDIVGAMIEKLVYNQNRADHKPENRVKAGGKTF